MKCTCRNCRKEYEEGKSRADYKGFCSQKCLHEKAKKLGWNKSKKRDEYDYLKEANCIGSVFV